MPDESTVRVDLAKHLRIDSVSDSLWDAMKALQQDIVEDALSMGGSAMEDLAQLAKSLIPYREFMEGNAPRRRKRKVSLEEYEFRLSGGEVDRARALAEYEALTATLRPETTRFRREILQNFLLTEAEASHLGWSEAARRFSYEWFEHWDVPLRDHESEFRNNFFVWRGDTAYEREYIFVGPPGRAFRVKAPEPYRFFYDLPSMSFVPDVRKGRVSRKEDLKRRVTTIYPGSVLDELRLASIELEKYVAPRWDAGQAAWFILTGKPPIPFALIGEAGATTFKGEDGEFYQKGTITLEVEPWVPAETVAKAYRDLQLGVLEENPRSVGPRNLEVFTFVLRSRRERLVSAQVEGRVPHKLLWRELMLEWNNANPQKAYTEYKIFNRDYHRAARKILDPGTDFEGLLTVPNSPEMLGS